MAWALSHSRPRRKTFRLQDPAMPRRSGTGIVSHHIAAVVVAVVTVATVMTAAVAVAFAVAVAVAVAVSDLVIDEC